MGGRSRVCGIGSRRRGYSWQGSPARPGESNVHSGIPRKNLGSAPIQDHPIRKLGPSGIGAPEGPTRYPKTGLANQSLARHTDRVGACGSPTRSRPIITVVYPASAIWSGHALERERRVRTFPSTADRNLALIAVLPV